ATKTTLAAIIDAFARPGAHGRELERRLNRPRPGVATSGAGSKPWSCAGGPTGWHSSILNQRTRCHRRRSPKAIPAFAIRQAWQGRCIPSLATHFAFGLWRSTPMRARKSSLMATAAAEAAVAVGAQVDQGWLGKEMRWVNHDIAVGRECRQRKCRFLRAEA